MVIRDCKVDDQRLEPLKECLPLPDPDAPPGEWPNNILSPHTVVYSCGRIARAGEVIEHAHDPQELARCRQLAEEAAAVMAGTPLGMSDEGTHYFTPFFITANAGAEVPRELTEAHLRAAFGGTIRPDSPVLIDPLREEGEWWRLASMQAVSDNDAKTLALWRWLLDWFNNHPHLHGACSVRIDCPPAVPPGMLPPSVLPRLLLALTDQGSLVGVLGCVVWT
jgi:hypothetical protein